MLTDKAFEIATERIRTANNTRSPEIWNYCHSNIYQMPWAEVMHWNRVLGNPDFCAPWASWHSRHKELARQIAGRE